MIKKAITTTVLGLVAAINVYGQGYFNPDTGKWRVPGTFNLNNNFVPVGATEKAYVLDITGKPADKDLTRIAVIYGNDGYLTPNGDEGVPLTLDGLFFINGLMVPVDQIGESATITIRAWDILTGLSWKDTALRTSVTVTINNLGGGLVPPATLANDSNFRGLDLRNCLIPEPSTYMMAGLGLVVLVMAVRKK